MGKNATPKGTPKKRALSSKGMTSESMTPQKRPATTTMTCPRSLKRAKQAAAAAVPVAEDMEEGEVDEADQLFMIDTAPSEPAPSEAALMKEFKAQVVADSDPDRGSDTDDDDDDDSEYDEHELKKAIENQIIDDSTAKATGRYYKEVDLTRSCVLCGVQGHSARDCPHEQCFVCGQIDSGHDARSCPTALVCNNCGSRGHIARTCANPRLSFDQRRCHICMSDRHVTANCQTNWRVYVAATKKKAMPRKAIVFACANCAATGDHFVDDCFLPRRHPLKYVDGSAFNRNALEGSVPNNRNVARHLHFTDSPSPSFAQAKFHEQRRTGTPDLLSRMSDDSSTTAAESSHSRNQNGPKGGRNGNKQYASPRRLALEGDRIQSSGVSAKYPIIGKRPGQTSREASVSSVESGEVRFSDRSRTNSPRLYHQQQSPVQPQRRQESFGMFKGGRGRGGQSTPRGGRNGPRYRGGYV